MIAATCYRGGGGGGYDINLVPQDLKLNRGHSEAGRRFREIENTWMANPGAFMFIRCLYEDTSDRPSGFEVGLQCNDGLRVEYFEN